MRKQTFVMCLAVWGAGMIGTSIALAEAASQPTSLPTSQPTTTQAATEADVIQATATKRAAGILEALALADPAKQAQVHAAMTAFYVKRLAWEPNDDRVKELEKQLARVPKDGVEARQLQTELTALREELARMRDSLLSELGKILSAEQMETVKDKMTYGQAKLIYNDANAKHALSDEQKAAIAKILADAREQAIVAGSAADKHRIFNQALAQVNAYLAAQAVPPAPPAQPKAPAPAVETPGP